MQAIRGAFVVLASVTVTITVTITVTVAVAVPVAVAVASESWNYYTAHDFLPVAAVEKNTRLTLLEPQSRFGDKRLKFQVFCPQNGTAVLKGLMVKRP